MLAFPNVPVLETTAVMSMKRDSVKCEWLQHRGNGEAMEKETIKELISCAFGAREHAYAPYSHFSVGAALLCMDGTIITGCNIENASYPAGNCAERTAFFNAISSGKQEFSAICVVGGPDGKEPDYCPPCGICRQVMSEFCNPDHFHIILAKDTNEYRVYTLGELLPLCFGRIRLAGES